MLTIPAGDSTLRLLPPLTISDSELDEALRRLDAACVDAEKAAGYGEGGGMNAPLKSKPRHFLDLLDHSTETLRGILTASAEMKAARRQDRRAAPRPLEGKTLAMIFERPSTRTRVSFDVGMRELGGETIMLTGAEMQLGRGETHRRHRARAVALRRRDHGAHSRSARSGGAGRTTRRCRSSTA